MALSNSLASYDDVKRVFDSIVQYNSPATLSFPAPGKAINFRQRAYKFRRLAQGRGIHDYDSLVIIRVGDTELRILPNPDLESVSISFDNEDARLVESAHAGTIEEDDPLLDFAKNLNLKAPE